MPSSHLATVVISLLDKHVNLDEQINMEDKMNSCINEEILFIPEFSQLSMSVGWWMGMIYENKAISAFN